MGENLDKNFQGFGVTLSPPPHPLLKNYILQNISFYTQFSKYYVTILKDNLPRLMNF